MDFAATNANKVQLRVRFYDADGVKLAKAFLTTMTGDSDFIRFCKTVELPSNARTMDIGVLAERPPSLETQWWLDDVTVSFLNLSVEPNRLAIPFTASAQGTHHVFVRALQTQTGGLLRVSLDAGPNGEPETRGLPSGLGGARGRP